MSSPLMYSLHCFQSYLSSNVSLEILFPCLKPSKFPSPLQIKFKCLIMGHLAQQVYHVAVDLRVVGSTASWVRRLLKNKIKNKQITTHALNSLFVCISKQVFHIYISTQYSVLSYDDLHTCFPSRYSFLESKDYDLFSFILPEPNRVPGIHS